MLVSIKKWGMSLFPERQILVRTEGRITHLTLTRRAQIVAATSLLAGFAAMIYVAVGYVHWGNVAAAKRAEIARAEVSNGELRELVAQLQAQLASASNDVDQAQNHLAAIGSQYGSLSGSITSTEQQLSDIGAARDHLIAERDALQQRLDVAQAQAGVKSDYAAQLAKNLQQNKSELNQSESQRAALAARIRQLEKDVQTANARTVDIKGTLDSTQKKLQQINADREKATLEREHLTAERDALQKKLRDAQARLAKAESKPAPAGGDGTQKASRPGTVSGSLGDLESLIASTGLDVENMLSRISGSPRGEGGPYIALGAAGQTLSPEEQAKRDETLRKLVKILPLALPLAHYTVESPFGPRTDPFNKRQAFHPGVDLSGAFRSPVYATGPGVVTFAGVRANYGKVVEIDHGMGIVTQYAHLHRTLVSRGQKVNEHQQIGELGSTGRSTGPHVHYGVMVDGEPVDPEKFMEAGKNVLQVSGKQ